LGQRRRGTLVTLCLVALIASATYGRADECPAVLGAIGWALSPTILNEAAPQEAVAGEVSVLGAWAGPDVDSFWAVVQPFAQRHGLKLRFESTPDVASVLAARVEAGTPPDIAILPGVGLVAHYARAGCLVPLRRVLPMDRLDQRYPAGWLDLVSVDGEPYGAFCRAANKSLVWYNPGEFQRRRWAVPLTWGEMVTLGERIARMGLTPWSLALGGPKAGGEQGTDWIENIILRAGGPQTYDQWVRHEIPWTDPAVRQAFLRWGQIVGRPRNLCGGPPGALHTDWVGAVDALYQEIPAAYLCMEGSFVQPLIERHFAQRAPGVDYDFFSLPPMSLEEDAPVLVGADTVVMFNNTSQARALLRYLASPEAQAMWVQRGGFFAPGRDLDLSEYPDALSRRAARQLAEAQTVRFDASQQMPPRVAEAFRHAVREFVENPGELEAILATVERVARDAYPRPPR